MSDPACAKCGAVDELRGGFCFDCASTGERRAAKRTVFQHLFAATRQVLRLRYEYALIEFLWAWERMTQTGDYQIGGTFDREYPGWRHEGMNEAGRST